MLSLLAKQGRMNSRTTEQGKRVQPHPEASPHTDMCGSGAGRGSLVLMILRQEYAIQWGGYARSGSASAIDPFLGQARLSLVLINH
jgi:hypothetical protein